MSQKIRLYRGPFNGKTLDHYDAGRDEITIRLPKPMSRRERWEFEADWFSKNLGYGYGDRSIPTSVLPHIQATYRLVRVPKVSIGGIQYGSSLNYVSPTSTIHSAICMHPDGSLFYEWVNPQKKK